MPYRLQRRGGKAKVVSKDTGRVHSKRYLPLARAKAQMRAMYANMPADEKAMIRRAKRRMRKRRT
mgnify:CR=1